MRKILPIAVAGLMVLLLPSTAAAATASAKVKIRGGIPRGPVRFVAARGERNRVTITERGGRFIFEDSANRVVAKGDCTQVDMHTARCPETEDLAKVKLGDRDDRARAQGGGFIDVLGGPGGDTLIGGRGSDRLFGGPGGDTLRGARDSDELSGGTGPDDVAGGSGDDRLFDQESDAEAARDVYSGGPSRDSASADQGDTLDYSRRRRALRIDLGRGRTSTEDRIIGMESITGGRGDDRLTGDDDDNWLDGGPGDDVVHGSGARDIPFGGRGDDRVFGDDGDDVVWGNRGRDHLDGGRGADAVLSLEDLDEPKAADEVVCGSGRDDTRPDNLDTLSGDCEIAVAFSNGLFVGVFPAIDADSADFSVTCTGGGGPTCQGTIALSRAGQSFGSTHFVVPGDNQGTPVSVLLTAAGKAALAQGTVVQVDLLPDAPSDLEEPGGYLAFMRAG